MRVAVVVVSVVVRCVGQKEGLRESERDGKTQRSRRAKPRDHHDGSSGSVRAPIATRQGTEEGGLFFPSPISLSADYTDHIRGATQCVGASWEEMRPLSFVSSRSAETSQCDETRGGQEGEDSRS